MRGGSTGAARPSVGSVSGVRARAGKRGVPAAGGGRHMRGNGGGCGPPRLPRRVAPRVPAGGRGTACHEHGAGGRGEGPPVWSGAHRTELGLWGVRGGSSRPPGGGARAPRGARPRHGLPPSWAIRNDISGGRRGGVWGRWPAREWGGVWRRDRHIGSLGRGSGRPERGSEGPACLRWCGVWQKPAKGDDRPGRGGAGRVAR